MDRSFYEEKRGWFKGGIEKMARRKQKNRKRLVERVGMKKERSGEKATGRSDGG